MIKKRITREDRVIRFCPRKRVVLPVISCYTKSNYSSRILEIIHLVNRDIMGGRGL